MYKSLIRPILFSFSPETAHGIVFRGLKIVGKMPLMTTVLDKIYSVKSKKLEKNIAGLNFKNPVGLAAGLDKDAEAYDELGSLGFGFVEIGTITPKAQPGNPKPRLFRLKKDKALINRMGFNNNGVDNCVKNLKRRKNKNLIIGGNIGKNKVTPNEKAVDDYLICFEEMYDYVDYFVINVSSPNTPNLRELQDKEPLKKLIESISELNSKLKANKPVFLKIAPDLTEGQIEDIVEIVNTSKLAGVVATNTTITRENLSVDNATLDEIGMGGLSGKPIKSKSLRIIKTLRDKLDNDKKIIGVGGISCAQDAVDTLNAGADLIQVYTGFIYEGPALIKKINKHLVRNL